MRNCISCLYDFTYKNVVNSVLILITMQKKSNLSFLLLYIFMTSTAIGQTKLIDREYMLEDFHKLSYDVAQGRKARTNEKKNTS